MWANALISLYILMVILLSIYGLNALVITTLYLLHFREKDTLPEAPAEWPTVCVQLPFYNEQYVAQRILDCVCAFRYPKDRLTIQILDDSSDETTEIIQQRIDHYRALGFSIEMLHRTDRSGYKAGALAEATARTNAEFVAIFDADFVPSPDFLQKTIPHFQKNPRIGMVQTRWGHLNRNTNLLTRVQALFLDGHQVVEQVARSRSNLLLNFNGTGGVWRTECIRESGGWQWDTFSEDIDISYRAQILGWKLIFLPDLIVPGEVPPSMTVFKKQQFRWTYGHIQVFRKLIRKIWQASNLTIPQRLGATFHLTANFIQLVALAMFLLSVPLAFFHPKQPASIGMLSMATFGPTILFAVSQIFGYHDGFKHTLDRLIHLPLLVILAIGLTISNFWAVISAIFGRKTTWARTPKANLVGKKNEWKPFTTQMRVPFGVWVEIALSIYCAFALSLALRHAPEMMALSALGMLSFAYVGGSCLVEISRPKKSSSVPLEMWQQ